ncbi:MAG: hypothetical protein H7A44_02825 [Opitutaceae bacterium]|nr:hypothetical protein [Cephaloticoccus sp.]MCP5529350.1 hypothetical protein [Opitutaceae bacterium]
MNTPAGKVIWVTGGAGYLGTPITIASLIAEPRHPQTSCNGRKETQKSVPVSFPATRAYRRLTRNFRDMMLCAFLRP